MIALASDHAGFELKEAIKKYLVDNNYDIMDFGTNSPASVDYPTFGRMAAEAVASGECDKGIVCCGTGIGISMAANKFKGIRAGLCSTQYQAEMTRRHNNANILCMGGKTIGEWEAIEMLEIFLNTPYDGGFHDGSLDLIKDIENLTMNDEVWNEEPRKISTGPLADAEIFDRSKG